jgi:hypothetical protein
MFCPFLDLVSPMSWVDIENQHAWLTFRRPIMDPLKILHDQVFCGPSALGMLHDHIGIIAEFLVKDVGELE